MEKQVIQLVADTKRVAIARGLEPKYCVPLAQAFYAGGIRAIEVTFNQKKPDEFYKTTDAIRAIKEAMGDRMAMPAQPAFINSPAFFSLTPPTASRGT